jgi:hypothetical protein
MTIIVNVHLVEREKIATLLQNPHLTHAKQIHVDQMVFALQQVSNHVELILIGNLS